MRELTNKLFGGQPMVLIAQHIAGDLECPGPRCHRTEASEGELVLIKARLQRDVSGRIGESLRDQRHMKEGSCSRRFWLCADYLGV